MSANGRSTSVGFLYFQSRAHTRTHARDESNAREEKRETPCFAFNLLALVMQLAQKTNTSHPIGFGGARRIKKWSLAFFFTLSSHWLAVIFSCFLIGGCDCFSFGS